uniref:Uncharacterized protein n=1 Tax=Oryza glumipatula TaxID=40148 RepID=A0A0E0BJI1_9ORYZ
MTKIPIAISPSTIASSSLSFCFPAASPRFASPPLPSSRAPPPASTSPEARRRRAPLLSSPPRLLPAPAPALRLGAIRIESKVVRMKKGLHPQMQWISYVTQSGRLINIMMTKVNHIGKVYHMRAKRQMAQSLGQIAKFNRRYQQESEENKEK